jgi:hypothetical protein
VSMSPGGERGRMSAISPTTNGSMAEVRELILDAPPCQWAEPTVVKIPPPPPSSPAPPEAPWDCRHSVPGIPLCTPDSPAISPHVSKPPASSLRLPAYCTPPARLPTPRFCLNLPIFPDHSHGLYPYSYRYPCSLAGYTGAGAVASQTDVIVASYRKAWRR